MQSRHVDPLALAIDWIDAYRSGAVEAMVALYDDDAVIECKCEGRIPFVGRARITSYWTERLARYSFVDLVDIAPDDADALVEYKSVNGLVRASLSFTDSSKIKLTRCGPVSHCPNPKNYTHLT
jgi:hypothetical protein